MFIRIRNRLTLLYSSLLMVFLIVFIVVTYVVFSYVIFHEHEEAVIKLANEAVSSHQNILSQWKIERLDKNNDDHHDDKNHRDRNKFQLSDDTFYFIVDSKGTVLATNTHDKEFQTEILKQLYAWEPRHKEIRYENIKVDDETVHLLLSGRSYSQNGKLVGMVYAGMDVEDQHEVLEGLLWILIFLAFFFLILSSILAYFMAGKAMRPIINSFAQQRQFVADASHELRTPLSVLHASIEVIEAEETNLSPMTTQVMADMKDETQRMSRLVGDLLTLARADSGRQQLSLDRFDMYVIMEKMIRSLQPIAHKRNIQLILTGSISLQVIADQERITQLLYILLDNAIKYTPAGGKVELSLNEIRKGNTRKVSISVSDTGIGMTEEQLQHIFDRFYRADPVRSRAQGGTGLGLSIAKWIVEAHHGSITVESKINVGSTFTAILPIIDKSP